jgi:hypothetical protein
MHACALVGSMEASVSSSSAEELPDQLSVLATSALTMKWYSAVTCVVTAPQHPRHGGLSAAL